MKTFEGPKEDQFHVLQRKDFFSSFKYLKTIPGGGSLSMTDGDGQKSLCLILDMLADMQAGGRHR